MTTKAQRRTVLFVPGFKGSTLKNQSGQLVWPNVIRAQFEHTTSLAMPYSDADKTDLIADDIVQSVTVLPWVWKVTVYDKLARLLNPKNSTDTRVQWFHYDWRQDLIQTGEQLRAVIEQLSDEQNGAIDIICHSMGGLIASYAMHAVKPGAVRNLFFVGVPFQGTLKVFLDMLYGSRLGVNKTLLSAQAIRSFPSTYYLLPQYAGALAGMDLLNPDDWRKLMPALFEGENPSLPFAFLSRQLQSARQFYHVLEEGKGFEHTKLFFIHSLLHPTPCRMQWHPVDKVEKTIGDGSVPDISLQVPAYLSHVEHETIYIDKRHAESFSDNQLLRILDAILFSS